MFRPESRSDAEIEVTLWQEVEEAREAELAEELNEPVTDVEPTAEAPVQESGVEPTNPEAAEVVEIKLTIYNLNKAGQAPVSIIPKVCIKLEFVDQQIRIQKGAQFSRFDAVRVAPRPCFVVSTLQKHANNGLTVTRAYAKNPLRSFRLQDKKKWLVSGLLV